MTGAELDSSSEKTTERSVLRLFSPLTAIMYAKDDWGELEECSEELFPSELCSYETEILEQIAKEYLLEEGDRGLAVYLDIPELEEKIYSMNNPVPVSLLSGDRKPQIRFLGNHPSGSGNLYHKSFRM